jgi:RNA polymerase sigma-70 factor, ECF subfamily
VWSGTLSWAYSPEDSLFAGAREGSAIRLSRVDVGRGNGAGLEELMERYVDGDAAAFEQLYQNVSPKLLGYLLRLTRHRERAEDLLQITFAKIHRARASYLRGAPLLPWVLSIARRSFFDERRAAKSRSEDLSSDGTLPEPRQEEDVVPNDLSEALERALDAMPEAYREAIQLTKITGLSMVEAADVLGTTPTAVKLRVHRGYNLLREELENFKRSS